MHIKLDQWRVADRPKAVDLSRLDDQNVSRSRLERLSVYGPDATALTYELHLIVRMPVWAGSPAGQGVKQEDRDVHSSLICPDELM